MYRSILLIMLSLYATIGQATCTNNISQTVNAVNQFAFDLQKQVSSDNQNTLLSPYSIASVLATLSAGAAESTQSQLLHSLHLDAQSDCSVSELNTLLPINKPCSGWYCQWIPPHIFSQEPTFIIANGIWGNARFQYKPSFLQPLENNITTSFYTADFENNPTQAREKINQWVIEKTRGNIRELISPDSITPLTQVILVNAIYFKGFWQEAFDTADTQQKPFILENGNKKSVLMMQQTSKFDYFENKSFQFLQLPYKKSDLQMIIILPKENTSLLQVQKLLNPTLFADALKNAANIKVTVSLPRFKLLETMDLKKILNNLGIVDMFSKNANFSRLSSTPLFISSVLQKAMIEVNESGTTATAATATALFGAAPAKPVQFNANHPFLFYIIDKKTGLILFMGKVAEPS